jgi:hypothetical protein
MDRQTLYLDIDEEITSVVDKLKSAEVSGLDLVIPKEALVLKSVVNLKLLKRQADSLGKEITIVTTDKVGRKLAEQIGIPVIEKPGQAPKEVRMSAVEPPQPTASDIEMKQSAKEVPKPEIMEEAEAAEVAAGADGPLVETGEVVSPVTAKAEESDPASSEVPKDEVSDKSKNPKTKMAKWKKWAIIGGFAALALAVAAYIFVPLSNITIKLAAEKKKVDFNFTADKANSSVDTTGQIVPARLIDENKEVTAKFPTTGKKKVGEKATGTVKIVNHNYSSSPVSIVGGSRITTAAGLVFRTNTNVTVPGFVKVGLNVTDGTVEVAATADQVGENYNIAANTTMSVPGLAGAAGDIYATNTGAFSGGSARDVQFVTQDDVNKAKDEVSKTGNGDFQRAIQDKVEDGERLLDNSIKINVTEATPSIAVNGEGAEFELKVKANVKAMVFKDEDLKKLAESVLGDQIGAGKEIVEKESLISATDFTDADYDKGVLHAKLSGEAYVATKLEQDKIKTELSGDGEATAMDYLKGIDGVDEVEIKFFPSFYKRLPRIKNHIYLKTSLDKVQS